MNYCALHVWRHVNGYKVHHFFPKYMTSAGTCYCNFSWYQHHCPTFFIEKRKTTHPEIWTCLVLLKIYSPFLTHHIIRISSANSSIECMDSKSLVNFTFTFQYKSNTYKINAIFFYFINKTNTGLIMWCEWHTSS